MIDFSIVILLIFWGNKYLKELFTTDWVPSLQLVFPFSYVTIQVQTASYQHYYEPAAILLISQVLTHLFQQDFKRSITTIPYFDVLRPPLSRYENDWFNSLNCSDRLRMISHAGVDTKLLAYS